MPNKYPAFEGHEVVVHTPRHTRSVAELDDREIELVVRAWRERARAAAARGLPYTQAVVNEGRDAGASLAHSHSQLVPLSAPPPLVAAEASERLAPLLAEEIGEGSRVVLERAGLVLLCPPAARMPYELLGAPVEPRTGAFSDGALPAALALVAEGVRRIAAVEGAVPLNAWLHDTAHWHLEVLPRLTIPASLELGAGVYINTLAPEEAAARLRGAIR